MIRASLLLALTACTTAAPESDDVTGPFTGARHRYVINSFALPINNAQARDQGADLDGDRIVDNAFGSVTATLAGQNNLSTHADAMITSGVLASSIEIQADDLGTDDAAGVWYYGADGEAATEVGGTIVDGIFTSNRTATTRAPGKAVLHLPVFVDADPTVIEIVGMQLELTPDGRGGYHGAVHGGLRPRDALTAAHLGIVQLLEARPQDHRSFWYLVDKDKNGIVTRADLEAPGSLVQSMISPDITRSIDGESVPLVSVGFVVHLAPCEAGQCVTTTSTDRCFNRVLDGDESDTDCGGSCGDCPGSALCRTGADCQSQSCNGGICGDPICFDGILNGYESETDCGGACMGCPSFAECSFDSDCFSGNCGNTNVCY